MNIQEYITSGILEEYVLGTVSPQEKREVECLAGIYPEIRKELDDLSVALENYAQTFRRNPPADLKEELLKTLDFASPAPQPETEESQTLVRPLWETNSRPTYKVSWVVAASTGLALFIFSLYLLSQLRNNQKTLATLRENNQHMEQELRLAQQYQQRAEQTLTLVKQPGTRLVQMNPVGKGQAKPVMLYWNAGSGEVQLEVDSLSRPPEFMQYQLWAIVDGNPVDAGVFDIQDWLHIVRTQKRFRKAEAFAITIEKRGGSPTPTMSSMVVMGETI